MENSSCQTNLEVASLAHKGNHADIIYLDFYEASALVLQGILIEKKNSTMQY